MAWPASPTTRITRELTSNEFCATVKTHKNVHFHGRACFRPEFEPPNCDSWSKVLTLLVVVAWWQTQPMGFNPTLSYLCCHCVICIESGLKWQFEHCPFQLWSTTDSPGKMSRDDVDHKPYCVNLSCSPLFEKKISWQWNKFKPRKAQTIAKSREMKYPIK